MSSGRRTVRITPAFFDDLDRQLRSERGPNGEPSVHDFEVNDLLPIVDEFATRFDELAELISGRTDYRILIAAGSLVPRYVVTAQLATDGAVELVQIDLDLDAGWE